MKSVYLIRHGQTLFNKQKKIQGFCDSPLTELGIQQAAIAGKHVLDLDLKFDDAYSSTSERACDTLELIADVPYKRIKGLRDGIRRFRSRRRTSKSPTSYGDFFVQFGGKMNLTFNIASTPPLPTNQRTDGENI